MLLVLERLGLGNSGSGWLADHGLLRALLAGMVSLALMLAFGRLAIAWLSRQFCEPIKSDSPTLRVLHAAKASTPTMGGLLIVAAILLALLLFGNWASPTIVAALFLVVGLATLGAVDDLTKLRTARPGISARQKLWGQFILSLTVAIYLYLAHRNTPAAFERTLPLFGTSGSLGLLFVPLAVAVIVGASNAVNVTDGLDGLASGCLVLAVLGMMGAIWAVGSPHPGETREVLVLAGAIVGATLGFLWFNRHPAAVFMGDTGSLPLGGLLGLLAVAAKQELLLAVVGAVFVAEAMSVIVQVAYYKWRRKRILLCAPLHHHFQFKGWSERTIVTRFWIVGIVSALAGIGLAAPLRPTARSADASMTTPHVDATFAHPGELASH